MEVTGHDDGDRSTSLSRLSETIAKGVIAIWFLLAPFDPIVPTVVMITNSALFLAAVIWLTRLPKSDFDKWRDQSRKRERLPS